MRSLTRALGFLSIAPMGNLAHFETGQIPLMLAAFPLAGAILGAALGAFWHVLNLFLDAQLSAAITVCAWATLTRGFHLDGLADCADGLGGGFTPEARLKIMKDPHIGAFGTIAIVGVLLVKYSALTALPAHPLPFAFPEQGKLIRGVVWFALIVSAARFGMLCGMVGARYARADGGLGKDFFPAAKPWVLLAAAPVPLALALLCGRERGLIVVAVPVAIALLFRLLVNRMLRGLTGDTLGAMVELGELGALISALFV